MDQIEVFPDWSIERDRVEQLVVHQICEGTAFWSQSCRFSTEPLLEMYWDPGDPHVILDFSQGGLFDPVDSVRRELVPITRIEPIDTDHQALHTGGYDILVINHASDSTTKFLPELLGDRVH